MWCTQVFFLEWFSVSVFVEPCRNVRLYLSFCEPHTGHCQVNRQATGFGTGAKWLPLGADKAFRTDKVRLQKGSFINDLIQIWVFWLPSLICPIFVSVFYTILNIFHLRSRISLDPFNLDTTCPRFKQCKYVYPPDLIKIFKI